MGYDNRLLAIGTAQLGYRAEGDGEHKIILLHGRNSHSGTWRRTLPALAQEYSVFAPSLPPDHADVTSALVERHACYVADMCDRLGITRASVVGNSLGGWVAMRLSSQGMVSKLVLEDTAGSTSEEARQLEGAAIPTLIVWGEDDDVISTDEARALHSRLAGSQLEVVAGAGHVPHWEQPEAFNRLLTRFLHDE